MIEAEFEEKEYEHPLYVQLLDSHKQLWTPGQVFEYHIGIDAALFVNDNLFWSSLGYSIPLGGAILNDFNWGRIWRKFGGTRPLPTFSTNLLLQAKRPDFLLGYKSNYAPFGLAKSYYRISLKKHQQEALEVISNRLGHRALVSYASPVFYTYSDLFHHISSNTLANSSNFVRADRLQGHKQWVYNVPGTQGIALSEPKPIEDANFSEQLSSLALETQTSEEPNRELAIESLLQIDEQLRPLQLGELLAKNPLVIEYMRRLALIDQNIEGNSIDLVAYRSYLRFAILAITLNVSWLVVGRGRE